MGENRNSKEQETMRKPTWREVRAWETKEHARTFLPHRRPPSLAGKMKRNEGQDEVVRKKKEKSNIMEE